MGGKGKDWSRRHYIHSHQSNVSKMTFHCSFGKWKRLFLGLIMFDNGLEYTVTSCNDYDYVLIERGSYFAWVENRKVLKYFT